jgi:uncharacterized iron-regulated protein
MRLSLPEPVVNHPVVNHPVVNHGYLIPQIKQAIIRISMLKAMLLTALLFNSTAVSAFSPASSPEKNTTMVYAGHTSSQTVEIEKLRVVDLQKTSPLSQIVEQIDGARVVLVGETHTRLDHHLVQLEILKLLYQKSPKLAVGLEWFQKPFQTHLDAYIAGEISEQEMLHLTGYYERWRYDYRLYQPIIQYAREHKIPLIALNSSRELNKALTTSGFDDLPADLKAQLPESYDWSDKDYEQRLRSIFELHPEYAEEFEAFLRGQLTWDETMAETAVNYLESNPESRLLIFAGSGHIMYGSGIPNRIKRRNDAEQVSILVTDGHTPVEEDIADFMVLSTPQMLEPAGLIGAFLQTEGKLLVIKEFSENSAAKDAGMPEGSVIVAVDTNKVESFSDFKLAVLDKKPGDIIEISYLESVDDSSNGVKSIKIELR